MLQRCGSVMMLTGSLLKKLAKFTLKFLYRATKRFRLSNLATRQFEKLAAATNLPYSTLT